MTQQVTNDMLAFDGGSLGFRNRIINGAMGIFQRGTPASTLNANTYFVDRWFAQVAGSGMAYAATQSTDGTVSQNGISHIYIQTITAKASLAVGEYAVLQQNIEGVNVADFKLGTASAKTFTLSFRANANTPTTASIAIRNGANNRSFVTTIALTTTPTNYSITVPGDTAGTWAVDNTAGMMVTFCFAANTAGTVTTSTLNAWQAGNYIAANTQSNGFDTLNRFINVTDVQLEKGTVATAFDVRPYGSELALCQRYYGFQQTQIPVSSALTPAYISYKTSMRTAATISGGGAGFGTVNSTTEGFQATQTAASNVTLTFSAEL